jgi:hypothetical protein
MIPTLPRHPTFRGDVCLKLCGPFVNFSRFRIAFTKRTNHIKADSIRATDRASLGSGLSGWSFREENIGAHRSSSRGGDKGGPRKHPGVAKQVGNPRFVDTDLFLRLHMKAGSKNTTPKAGEK